MLNVAPEESDTFGGLLRVLRMRAGLTLRQLGEKTGYTGSLLSRLEKDERQPNLKWVEQTLLPALDIQEPALSARLLTLAIQARHDERHSTLLADSEATFSSAISLSTFIGRRTDMKVLADDLGKRRLVTLCGTGGCGKTRLAVETAQMLRKKHNQEVWFIDLSACREPAVVLNTVAVGLRISLASGNPIADIARFFGARPALLLIDNAEHVIGECAMLADRLLHACPQLSILVTSREPLRIHGEHVCRLTPLNLPQPDEIADLGSDQLRQFEAIALFIERAQEVMSNAAPLFETDSMRKAARICWRLDGLPLAIELAAARMASMTLDDILKQMDDRFALLTTGSRVAPDRQVSLELAIDWSHVLLNELERRIFRRLAVFAGGWTLQMAEQVCAGDQFAASEVTQAVNALVEKSMVVFSVDAWGNGRYNMLESIRAYAEQKLMESGERQMTGQRHALCLLRLVEDAELKLFGTAQVDVLRQLEINLDNIRAALAWLMHSGDYNPVLQMLGALRRFWQTRSHVSEGRQWLSLVLLHRDAAPVDFRARAVFTAAVLADYQSDVEASVALSEEAAALAVQCNDRWLTAQILGGLVYRDQSSETRVEWRRRIMQEHDIGVELGCAWLVGDAHHKLAGIEALNGNIDAALDCLQRSETELIKAGDAIYATVNDVWLGVLLLDQKSYASSKRHFLKALAQMQRAGLNHSEYIAISYCLQGLADLAAVEQLPERMAQLLGAVELEREGLGGVANHWLPRLDVHEATARFAQFAGAPVDAAIFSYFWQRGRQRTLAQSVTFALNVAEIET